MSNNLNTMALELEKVIEKNNLRGYALIVDFESLDKTLETDAKFSTGDIASNSLIIQLLNNQEVIILDKNDAVYILVKNPKGDIVYLPCDILDGDLGIIVTKLDTNSVSESGLYEFDITITNGKDYKMVSPRMSYNTYENIGKVLEDPSGEKVTILDTLIAEVNTTKKFNQEKYDLVLALSSENANLEIIDARNGEKNLGTRLTNIETSLQDIKNNKATQKIIQKMINKEVVKIVCYGDSVTYGFIPHNQTGAGTKTTNPYPETLQKLLRDYYGYNEIYVYNEGFSGRQSDELASDEYITCVKNHNPDLVILMVGLNDKLGNFGEVKPISEYMDCLKIIYNKLSNYEMLLMTLTPNYSADSIGISNKIQKINGDIYSNAIKNFALINSIELFDINPYIDNYFKYNIINRCKGQPDFLHYSDEMYMNIAKVLYINKFYPINTIVNNETKFDCIHGIFKTNTFKYFNGVEQNVDKYNLIFTEDNNVELELFINVKKMNLYINTFKNKIGSYFIVNIDDKDISKIICNHPNSDVKGIKSMCINDVFVKELEYGYHKIIFKGYTDSNDNVESFVSSISLKEQARDMCVDTNVLITEDATTNAMFTSFKKIGNLNETKIQHRIYFSSTKKGGIGIGSTKTNNGDYPLLYLHLSNDYYQLYLSNNVNTDSWVLISQVQHSNASDNGYIDSIVDIIKHDGSISIYIGNELLYETDDMSYLGDESIYLINYKSLATDTFIKTIIQKIESYDYYLGVNKFNELDNYYSYGENTIKRYLNGKWI